MPSHSGPGRIVVLIAALAFMALTGGSASATPANLCVNQGGTGGCFDRIQDAVNATGKSGAVISIACCFYFETVVIPKITLTLNADPTTQLIGNINDTANITIAAGAKVTINNLAVVGGFSTTGGGCIESAGTLTMQNTRVQECNGTKGAAIHQVGGKLTMISSNILSASATGDGGCLAMEGGTLNLQRVNISQCIAGGDGGGIWLSNTKATITGFNGASFRIENNQASGSGGGIFASGGKVTIDAMEDMSSNFALAGNGGGIQSMSSLTITNSNIDNNFASDDGGGILAQAPGKLSVINSSLVGNSSQSDGGGIAVATTYSLLNDTFFDNHADGNGGAISAQANGKINSLTIDANDSFSSGGGINISGGSVKITNTVIGLNAASLSGPDCGGSFASQGFNLIFNTSGCAISGQTATNTVSADPKLGLPGAFDGLLVQQPQIGSPVLGKGGHCPATDEVLQSRPRTGCDIGAFESP